MLFSVSCLAPARSTSPHQTHQHTRERQRVNLLTSAYRTSVVGQGAAGGSGLMVGREREGLAATGGQPHIRYPYQVNT